MTSHDLVLLVAVLMVLTDCTLAPVERRRLWPLLYLCYFAPLFALMADLARVQGSVLLMALIVGALLTMLHQAAPSETNRSASTLQ